MMNGFTRLRSPRDVLGLFVRRLWLFLIVSGLTALAMGAFIATRVPRYESTAQIEIDVHRQSPMAPAVALPEKSDQGIVGTQMKRIASRTIAARVVDQLGLSHDPEWSPEPGRLAQWIAPTPLVPEETRRRRAIDTLMAAMTVERDEVAPVVSVRVASGDPKRAADIVNAVADAYLEEASEAGRAAAAGEAGVLRRQLDRLASEVTSADAALADYRASHGLTALSATTGGAVEQQAAALAGQLAAVQSESAAQQARATVASGMIAAGRGDGFAEVVQSPAMTQLRQQQGATAAQLAEARVRYGPDHPRVRRVAAQAADIDQAIRDEQARIAGSVQGSAQASAQAVGAVAAQLAAVRGKQAGQTMAQVGADRLARIADAKRTTYVQLAQSAARSSQEGALTSLPGTVITRGIPAMQPTYPRTELLVLLALLASPAMGVIAVLGVEAFDTRVRGPRELIALPGAGHVSAVSKVSGKVLKQIDRRAKPWDYVLAKPMSSFAESVRAVRRRLAFCRAGRGSLVVSITSSVPHEGKSTLSASLARTMALAGDRVLLIDCDLRRNGLADLLPDALEAGLAEVLEGSVELDEAVVRDAAPGLDVLPLAGPRFTPQDVFGDGRMARLMARLREDYEYVILDAPPVLMIDDAVTLARLSDAVLLAIRWGSTRLETISAAMERLREAGDQPIELVMTAVEPRASFSSYREPHYYLSAASGYHVN